MADSSEDGWANVQDMAKGTKKMQSGGYAEGSTSSSSAGPGIKAEKSETEKAAKTDRKKKGR